MKPYELRPSAVPNSTMYQHLLTDTIATPAPAAEQKIDTPIGDEVYLDGMFGRKYNSLSLESINDELLTEVYVTTESGNEYAILPTKIYNDKFSSTHTLINKNQSITRFKSNEGLHQTPLDEHTIKTGSLTVGESFRYGNGKTTKITSITTAYFSDISRAKEEVDDMVIAEDRTQFWADLLAARKVKYEKIQTDHISNDDYRLIDIFLYPENEPMTTYSSLVGDKPNRLCKTWDSEEQKRAQAGVRRLFEVELGA